MPHHSKELNIGRAGQFLTLFDLLYKGVNAFSTDEGMNYDIIAEVDGRLVKIQVKTTSTNRLHSRNSVNPIHLFHVRRAGKNANRMYEPSEFDGFALVALDLKEVFYLPFDEQTKSSIILRDKKIKYGRGGNWVRKGIYYQDLTWDKFCDVIRARWDRLQKSKIQSQ